MPDVPTFSRPLDLFNNAQMKTSENATITKSYTMNPDVANLLLDTGSLSNRAYLSENPKTLHASSLAVSTVDQIQLPNQPTSDLSLGSLDASAAAFGTAADTVTTTATGDNNIDGLLSGVQWAATDVSFSFTDSFSNDYEAGYPNAATHASSFQMLNATQQAAARDWIGTAGEFFNVSLLNPSDLTGANDQNATIRMAVSSDPSTAYAYYPGSTDVDGDIWFGTQYDYSNPVIGTYAYYVFGHELGHALGLKHGNETGGISNVAMNSDRDSMEFSIMTYRSYIGAPTDFVYNAMGSYAQTLMMYDIAAIQHMYGAEFDTNSDNTIYTFSTTTGEMFINGTGQGTPYSNNIFRTIWDGDGVDTYDFSNYSTNLAIDLTPGSWVDLDVAGNFQRANLGNGHYARAQVFNALQYNNDVRSLIENAYGGSGNDVIIGNTTANQLNGGNGNDTLDGKAGIDSMIGGFGNDIYVVDKVHDVVTENLNEGTDKINSGVSYTLSVNVENLTLTGTLAINGTGNNLANVITGNTAINKLIGGAGNDTLDGKLGNNVLTGGAGKDSFKFTTTGHIDTITDFVVIDDTIKLENKVFTALTTTGKLAVDQFVINTQALDANDFIIYNSAAGKVLYDADGNGAGAALQITTVGVGLAMTNADFVVI